MLLLCNLNNSLKKYYTKNLCYILFLFFPFSNPSFIKCLFLNRKKLLFMAKSNKSLKCTKHLNVKRRVLYNIPTHTNTHTHTCVYNKHINTAKKHINFHFNFNICMMLLWTWKWWSAYIPHFLSTYNKLKSLYFFFSRVVLKKIAQNFNWLSFYFYVVRTYPAILYVLIQYILFTS